MKKLMLLASAMVVCYAQTHAQSSFFQLTNVHFDYSNGTVTTGALVIGNPIFILNETPNGGGIVLPDAEGKVYNHYTQIPLVLEGLTRWFFYPSQSWSTYHFQNEYLIVDNDIDLSFPSDCLSACDGSICAPVPFSIDTVASTLEINGNYCISDLCPGTYSLQFDTIFAPDTLNFPEYVNSPWLAPTIAYTNAPIQVEMEELNAYLTFDQETTAFTWGASGGSGNYNFEFWNSADLYSISSVDYNTPGCYTMTVTDELTGCSATIQDYFSEYMMGDLAISIDPVTGEVEDLQCVNASDLLLLLNSWNNENFDPASDFNCDNLVNSTDLLFLLSVWFHCYYITE
jgi:hypothetical protein